MSAYLLDGISNSMIQVPLSVQIREGVMPIPDISSSIHYASLFCSIEEQYS